MSLLRRRAMIGQNKYKLPVGYQRVKYIESTGAQFIDHRRAFGSYCQLNFSLEFTKLKGYYNIFDHVNNVQGYNMLWVDNNGRFESAGSYKYGYVQLKLTDIKVLFNYNVQYVYIDGNFSCNAPYLPNATISFLRRVIRNDVSFVGKVFGYSAIENGEKVIDIVPVLKEGNPGLYDVVTGTFFQNIGSGKFGYETLDGTYVAPV